MNKLLISIIVPTYNSSHCIDACLQSIRSQSYENIELIVVDNNSKDSTKEIAKRYTQNVLNKGPERSAQRNFGVKKSTGQYVAIIDSDMELTENVIKECVTEIEKNNATIGLVIPEESFGKGLWANCKKLERSFYVGVDCMEAARFFRKASYEEVGGYNEQLVSGEDWDLSQRISKVGKIGRIKSYIYHNEGSISLLKTIKKKYYYAQKFSHYISVNSDEKKIRQQTSIIDRYLLFFSNPKKLFRNPFLGLSMIFMKTCEFGVGGVGYMIGKLRAYEKHT